jgi:hypothetical protein
MASRKHPPHRAENRLWKATSAWNSFSNVRDACDYILSNHIQPDDLIYFPLVTAISVLYARPFKRSRGIESLSVQFVLKNFRLLHHLLISFRDQTAAHVDAKSFRFKGRPANHVRLIVRNRQPYLQSHGVKFKLSVISEIRDLANALVERTLKYINDVVSEYPNEVPDGEYLIDLATGTFVPD